MDTNVTLVGNVVRAPEIRFSQGGTAVASFSVAVNRRVKRGDDWEEEVSYYDCVAYGSLAENIGESLTKGTRTVITGRLNQRSFEVDGEKRNKIEVVVEDAGPSVRFASVEVTRNERKER